MRTTILTSFIFMERMKRSMAYRSFFDAGIRAAAGSDFSPGPVRPADGHSGHGDTHWLEWRDLGANQRISVDEALLVNTINGAYNSHEEVIKGSITPGKLTDFVVLADDLSSNSLTISRRNSRNCEVFGRHLTRSW